MINLEKHIKEQRLQMDAERPSEGHKERFMQKLEQQQGRKTREIRQFLQIAASVAVILAASVFIVKQLQPEASLSNNILPMAVQEADNYYTTQVGQRYEQISSFNFSNEEEKTVLLEELDDLEAYHTQLMKDLETNPGDERIINAMVRHYQVKLEVMDQIIKQLNQVKTKINPSYEKEAI